MSQLRPVDPDRIRDLLADRDLTFGTCRSTEVAVPTRNAVLFWNLANDQILQLRAQWRGVARDGEQFCGLIRAVQQCNRLRAGPKAYLAPFDDGRRYGLVAECDMVASAGITQHQLEIFWETSMRMIMDFFHDVEAQLPDLVTWGDGAEAVR